MPGKLIGIDLGTTNSLVACVRNERPDGIGDCNLEYLLPSVVSYAERSPSSARAPSPRAATK